MREEKREAEISLCKSYLLPIFKVIEYKNYYLVIFIEIAKWIIINNKIQKKIFNSISERKTVKELIEIYPEDEEDIIYILTQLEAKNIEKTIPHSIFENKKLHLHLTNRCNLRCYHCYVESGVESKNELSFEEIKELCISFKNKGGTHISLTGGEPTLREDFEDIVLHASGIGLKVSIFSNGCLWTEEKIKRLPKNIEGIQISLDGYDEKSNSVVRGKGEFNKALNTIDLFVKNGVKVKIAVTPEYETLKNNSENFVSFTKQLLNKYGTRIEVNYSYYLMIGRELKQELINERKSEYYNLIDKIVTQLYENADEEVFIRNLRNSKIFDSCGYGGLNVMANGDYYFCDRIPDVGKIGNIRCESFESIFEKMQKAENLGKTDNFKPCGKCELKYICGGGCRVEYFPDFAKESDIDKINFNLLPPRDCTEENKEKLYNLMISLNERFYE